MHRPLRALAIGAVIVLAGCGGTNFDSVASSPGSKATPTTSNAPAVATIAERPYVDAMVASAAASDGSADFTAKIARCVSTAIVRGYGVNVFVSSGITPNGLRNPDSTLDALPDPTDAQIASIGAELQRCRTGGLLAKSFAEGLKITDATAIACFTEGIDTDPSLRGFIVTSYLARKVDLATAHQIVGLLSRCVDLPAFILRSGKVPVDATTKACLINALNGSDAELKDYFALLISGADHDLQQQRLEVVAVAMNHCRPSAHTGFTIPSN